jgi:hypothetical protein
VDDDVRLDLVAAAGRSAHPALLHPEVPAVDEPVRREAVEEQCSELVEGDGDVREPAMGAPPGEDVVHRRGQGQGPARQQHDGAVRVLLERRRGVAPGEDRLRLVGPPG